MSEAGGAGQGNVGGFKCLLQVIESDYESSRFA